MAHPHRGSASLSLILTVSHPHHASASLSLSLTVAQPRCPSASLSPSLTVTQPHCLPASLSLSLIETHLELLLARRVVLIVISIGSLSSTSPCGTAQSAPESVHTISGAITHPLHLHTLGIRAVLVSDPVLLLCGIVCFRGVRSSRLVVIGVFDTRSFCLPCP